MWESPLPAEVLRLPAELARVDAPTRTRLDGTEGARTWTGYGILAHNLVKISTIAS